MIKPIGERVLVLPNETQDSWDAEGRIAKPDASRERPQEGTVVAVGDLVRTVKIVEPMRDPESERGYKHVPVVKGGDQVFYGKFSGAEMRIDGIEFVMLLVDDILGVVDPKLTVEGLIALAGRSVPKAKPHPLATPEPSSIIQP